MWRPRSLCVVAFLALVAPALDRLQGAVATRVDVHAEQVAVLNLERPEDVHLDVDAAAGAARQLVGVDEDAMFAERLHRPRLDPNSSHASSHSALHSMKPSRPR